MLLRPRLQPQLLELLLLLLLLLVMVMVMVVMVMLLLLLVMVMVMLVMLLLLLVMVMVMVTAHLRNVLSAAVYLPSRRHVKVSYRAIPSHLALTACASAPTRITATSRYLAVAWLSLMYTFIRNDCRNIQSQVEHKM